MIKPFSVFFACLAVAALGAGNARAEKVEVKGPHICCKQCVNIVGKILKDVAGVSEVSADGKTKTVTFNAKDEAAAKAGFKALIDGGFYGSATCDGKDLPVDAPAVPKGEKTDVVVVKSVHVCCGQCESGIKKLFNKEATITFEGKGPQRTVRIEGGRLSAGQVLEALRKGGFNGTPEK